MNIILIAIVIVLSQSLPMQPDFILERHDDLMDFPSSPLKAVYGLPFTGTQIPGAELDNPEEPEELLDEPVEEPPQEIPTFFGKPAGGKIVLVLDRSGSMGIQDNTSAIEDNNGNTITNPTRMQILKVEAISLLSKLSENDWFAIVSFGYPTLTAYQNLVQATPPNVAAGIATINALIVNGGTPAHIALKTGCQKYGSALDHLFFVCDGYPSGDQSSPGPPVILVEFPIWFAPLKVSGCQFTCIHIGGDVYSTQFMTQLANSVDGDYIKR